MIDLGEWIAASSLAIDVAGLFVAAALLVTLVATEVRRAGPDAGQLAPAGVLGRRGGRGIVAIMWMLCLLLFLPRVLGLLV